MNAQLIFGLFLILLAVACTPRPKPQHVPPPPAAEPAKPQKVVARKGDMPVHNCIVTKQGKDFSDCLCRHASTRINSETGAQSLECRTESKK